MSSLDDRIQSIVSSTEDIETQLDGLNDEQEPRKFELVKVEYDEVATHKEEENSDKFDDYVKTRTILHGVLERGMVALEGSLMVAQESEHPRAYEVSSSIMKNLAEISKDLMALHKDMEKKEDTPKVQNNTQVNNTYNITANSSENDVGKVLDALDDED